MNTIRIVLVCNVVVVFSLSLFSGCAEPKPAAQKEAEPSGPGASASNATSPQSTPSPPAETPSTAAQPPAGTGTPSTGSPFGRVPGLPPGALVPVKRREVYTFTSPSFQGPGEPADALRKVLETWKLYFDLDSIEVSEQEGKLRLTFTSVWNPGSPPDIVDLSRAVENAGFSDVRGGGFQEVVPEDDAKQ